MSAGDLTIRLSRPALMKAGRSWDIAAMVVSAASGEPLWGTIPVDVTSDVLYFVGEETPLNCMCVEAPLQVAQELAAALAASPALDLPRLRPSPYAPLI